MPKIAPISPDLPDSTYSFRWGVAILDEMPFLRIYQFLLHYYSRLGLSPTEMMFIIHLAEYRYESPNGRATPSLRAIATHMGYTDLQQIRRIKQRLVARGLLLVLPQPGYPDIYDVSPLAAAALELWQQDRQARSVAPARPTAAPPAIPAPAPAPAPPARDPAPALACPPPPRPGHATATPAHRPPPALAARQPAAPVPRPTPLQSERGDQKETPPLIQSERGGLSRKRAEEREREPKTTKDDSIRTDQSSNKYGGVYSPYVAGVIMDYSRELGDGINTAANITQAHRIWHASGVTEGAFVERLQDAKRRERLYQGKQGAGTITNKMGYLFRIVREALGVPAPAPAGLSATALRGGVCAVAGG